MRAAFNPMRYETPPTYDSEVGLAPVLLERPLRPLLGQVVDAAGVEVLPESGEEGGADVAARLGVHQRDEHGPRRHGGRRSLFTRCYRALHRSSLYLFLGIFRPFRVFIQQLFTAKDKQEQRGEPVLPLVGPASATLPPRSQCLRPPHEFRAKFFEGGNSSVGLTTFCSDVSVRCQWTPSPPPPLIAIHADGVSAGGDLFDGVVARRPGDSEISKTNTALSSSSPLRKSKGGSSSPGKCPLPE